VARIASALPTPNQTHQDDPGEPSERGAEATLLLSAVLESCARPTAGETETFGRCLLTLLGEVSSGTQPTPTALSNLLACFDLEGYAGVLLADASREGGLGTGEGEGVGAGVRGAKEPPRHAAELLGVVGSMFLLAGGHTAAGSILQGLLRQNSRGTFPGLPASIRMNAITVFPDSSSQVLSLCLSRCYPV